MLTAPSPVSARFWLTCMGSKARIDWFAVDVVCGGGQMRLRPQERRAVVRRMDDKLLHMNMKARDQSGKISIEALADRMFCTPRTAQRIKDELPPADKRTCPVCGQHMWVWPNEIVEAHPDSFYNECPLSNTPAIDEDWEQRVALQVVWLASRLRAGDVVGVWDYLGKLTVGEGRRLLVATLAAVPEIEDPFEWLQEDVA